MHLGKVWGKYSTYLLVSSDIKHSDALHLKHLHFLSSQLAREKHSLWGKEMPVNRMGAKHIHGEGESPFGKERSGPLAPLRVLASSTSPTKRG